jgi:hypothetical protein
MTVKLQESEIHDIDVLAQTITHLAAHLSLHDPMREPIEVVAGIIIDKTREWQRQYEASLRDTRHEGRRVNGRNAGSQPARSASAPRSIASATCRNQIEKVAPKVPSGHRMGIDE